MKYPIGIQDFRSIIEDGYVYVDKTTLIYNMVHDGKIYFLSRPRRFGKSLLVSTLEYYFSGKKELFRGLKIEALEKDWKTYPVFHVDFNSTAFQDGKALRDLIAGTVEPSPLATCSPRTLCCPTWHRWCVRLPPPTQEKYISSAPASRRRQGRLTDGK